MQEWQFSKPDFSDAKAWGSIGIVATLLCTALGVWMKDLTWLFVAAWFISIVPTVIFTAGVSPAVVRVLTILFVWVAVGVCLVGLVVKYRPAPEIRVTPIISWFPAPLGAGTPLSSHQLNAVALVDGNDVGGTPVYSPAAGTTLLPGGQTLSVTFQFSDPAYVSASKSVTVAVQPAPVPLRQGKHDDVRENTLDLSHQIIVYEFNRDAARQQQEGRGVERNPNESVASYMSRLNTKMQQDHDAYASIDLQFDTTFGTRIQEILEELASRQNMDTTQLWKFYQERNHFALGFGLQNIATQMDRHTRAVSLTQDQQSLLTNKLKIGNYSDPRRGWYAKLNVFSSDDRSSLLLARQILAAAKDSGWQVNPDIQALPGEEFNLKGIHAEGVSDGTLAMMQFAFSIMGVPLTAKEKEIDGNPFVINLYVGHAATAPS